MAHFHVCIVVENNGLTIEQLSDKAARAINKYSSEIDVAPYKSYLDGEELERAKKHYETENLQELAQTLAKYYPTSYYVDEKGLYCNSTTVDNPEGQFDYGDLLGQILPEDFNRLLFAEDEDTRACTAMVTPDGEWIEVEGYVRFGVITDEDHKQLLRWFERMKKVLEKYPDANVFLADCHS